MKKKVPLKIGVLFALLAGFITLTCSKDVYSDPRFVFKPNPNTTLAARFQNKEVTQKELNQGIEGEIFEFEMKIHNLRMTRLRALMLEKIIESDPKSKSLTRDEYLNRHIAKKIKITKPQIDQFIKEKKIPKKHLNEEMRKRIKAYLESEEKKKSIDAWMGKKTAKTPIEVYFPKPSRPTFKIEINDSPVLGKANAPITLVEFSDFQCPFCSKGAELIKKLKKKYGKKLKVVFKNFPLPFHGNAPIAAEAGLCVHQQDPDQFWKMHDLMFAHQNKLNREGLISHARKLKIDMQKFTACLDQGTFRNKVNADMEQGKKIGVKSTPTFFINGKMINGAQPLSVFSEIIDEELSR